MLKSAIDQAIGVAYHLEIRENPTHHERIYRFVPIVVVENVSLTWGIGTKRPRLGLRRLMGCFRIADVEFGR
jgi:hypothetical protein